MAEAFCKPPAQKKRKSDGKNMKLLKQLSVLEGADSIRTGSPLTSSGSDLTNASPEFKRTYHLGGKKYAVFHGPNGLINQIHLKEWDGKTITSGMSLNLFKFVTFLHNTEYVTQTLKKIIAGDTDVNLKLHIGELVHITCNSPYKIVQFRKWKKNREEELYPTKEGISLKPKEWEEFVKFSNQVYGERLEVYKCTPCLIDPNQANHNALTCPECAVFQQEARGLVDVDIPL